MGAVLFTACAISVLACAYSVWRAARSADEAQASANRLLTTQGKIAGVISALEEHELRWRKLNGKLSSVATEVTELHEAFYGAIDQYDELVGRPDNFPPTLGTRDLIRELNGSTGLKVCENYALAQINGPDSEAAKCSCGFCTEKRAQRAATRRSQLPKTVGEMHDAAKRGLAQP